MPSTIFFPVRFRQTAARTISARLSHKFAVENLVGTVGCLNEHSKFRLHIPVLCVFENTSLQKFWGVLYRGSPWRGIKFHFLGATMMENRLSLRMSRLSPWAMYARRPPPPGGSTLPSSFVPFFSTTFRKNIVFKP